MGRQLPLTVDYETEQVPEDENKAKGGGLRRQEVGLNHNAAEHVKGGDLQGKIFPRGPHHHPHHWTHQQCGRRDESPHLK